MIVDLLDEYNLRGYGFEYIGRVLLRRKRDNNFIFLINRFDGVEEIIQKYKFDVSDVSTEKMRFLSDTWKGDVIEFVLSDKEKRLVKDICLYEIKTMRNTSKRKCYEICLTDYLFYKKAEKLGIFVSFVSITLFEDWRFSFNIYDFWKTLLRVRNSKTKQTYFYTDMKNRDKKKKVIGFSPI